MICPPKNPSWRRLFCTVIGLSGYLSVPLMLPGLTFAAETQYAADTACDLHRAACTQPLSGGSGTVTLEILPKPVRAMTDLVFSVQVAGIPSKAVPYIDLGMPGMNMGPNRVSLKAGENGVFTGSGIIVRCPSGKTLWLATVTLPGAGTAEFLVNVVY